MSNVGAAVVPAACVPPATVARTPTIRVLPAAGAAAVFNEAAECSTTIVTNSMADQHNQELLFLFLLILLHIFFLLYQTIFYV